MHQLDSNTQRNHSNSLKKNLIRVNVNSRCLPHDFFPNFGSLSPSRNSDHNKSNQITNSTAPNSPQSPQKRFLNKVRKEKHLLMKHQQLTKDSQRSIEKIVEKAIDKNLCYYQIHQKQDSARVQLYLQMIKANLRNSFKENDNFKKTSNVKQQNKNLRQNNHINSEISHKDGKQKNFNQDQRRGLKSQRNSRQNIKSRSSSLIKIRRSLNTANAAGDSNPRKSKQKMLFCQQLKLKYRYSNLQECKIKQQKQRKQQNFEAQFDPTGIFTFYGNVNATLNSKKGVSQTNDHKQTLKTRLPKIK